MVAGLLLRACFFCCFVQGRLMAMQSRLMSLEVRSHWEVTTACGPALLLTAFLCRVVERVQQGDLQVGAASLNSTPTLSALQTLACLLRTHCDI